MSSRRDSQGRSCANCNNRPADKSRSDHLCAKCAHKLPRTQCHYCRTTYHLLSKHSNLPPSQHLCTACTSDLALFGAPQLCSLCRFQAAFDSKPGSSLCRHCASDSKRFGAPLQCLHCGFLCAFDRDAESKAKVDGLTLCFLCTHQFKTIKKKEGAHLDADTLREVFAKRDAEKRPRDEEVAADIAEVTRSRAAAAAEANGGGKRQRLEPPPPPQAAAAAAASSAASAASPFSSSPSASPSPSPHHHSSSSSFSSPLNAGTSASGSGSALAASSFSLSGSSPVIAAQTAPAALSSTAQAERIALLQTKLVAVTAQLAAANKAAEDARAAMTSKDKECNQLRGELEAARRAIDARKDSQRHAQQNEALRNLNQAPNPNHARAAAAAAANQEVAEDDSEIKI